MRKLRSKVNILFTSMITNNSLENNIQNYRYRNNILYVIYKYIYIYIYIDYIYIYIYIYIDYYYKLKKYIFNI